MAAPGAIRCHVGRGARRARPMGYRIRAGPQNRTASTARWARSRSSVSPEAVREHASAHSTDPRRAQG